MQLIVWEAIPLARRVNNFLTLQMLIRELPVRYANCWQSGENAKDEHAAIVERVPSGTPPSECQNLMERLLERQASNLPSGEIDGAHAFPPVLGSA